MKRLILFSLLTEQIKQKIVPLTFPKEIQHKVFAYMPSEGVERNRKYESFTHEWQVIASQHDAQFLLIDNATEDVAEERAKLSSANVLLITGGNPCILLSNLRKSGMDKVIAALSTKDDCVLAGYSAGAMIFTPTVQMCAGEDNRNTQLTNFDALNFVDYEIFPHYSEQSKAEFEQYKQKTLYIVKPIADDEYIVVEPFGKLQSPFDELIRMFEGPEEANHDDIYR